MSRYTKSSGSLLQKILIIALIIAAIAALGSLLPSSGGNKATTSSDKNTNKVTYKTLYLVPSRDWASDNSSYAAWCFSSTNHPAAGHVTGIDTNGDGIIEFRVPSYYDNVLFIDVKSGTSFNGNWDNKREQTGDLLVPTDGNVYYHQYASEWRAEGESTEPEIVVTTDPVNVYLVNNNTEQVFRLYVFNKFTGVGSFLELSDQNYDGNVLVRNFEIPAGNTHLIVTKHELIDGAAPGWDNVISQTGDLLIPLDGNVYCNLTTEPYEWTSEMPTFD